MELIADETFGVETVTVAGVQKALDVCELADALYMAISSVPDGTDALHETQVIGKATAAVFVQYGFPEIAVPAAAYMFAARVVMRGLELKKAVSDVWSISAGPASPASTPDSTYSD